MPWNLWGFIGQVKLGNYDALVSFYTPHGCSAIVTFTVTSSTSPVNVYVVNFTLYFDWAMAYVTVSYFVSLFSTFDNTMYGLIYSYTNLLYQYGYINYSAYNKLTYILNTTLKPEIQYNMEQYENELMTSYTPYTSLSKLSVYYWYGWYSLTQTITVMNNAVNMTLGN